jgi:hypothetical protein
MLRRTGFPLARGRQSWTLFSNSGKTFSQRKTFWPGRRPLNTGWRSAVPRPETARSRGSPCR